MSININEKELIKQIRASKNKLIWSVQDDMHYITNRHWAVRYDSLSTSLLTTLFSIFAEIPCNNSSLRVYMGDIQKVEPVVDVRGVMTMSENHRPGRVTDVLLEAKILMRVIEYDEGLLYINDEYLKIVSDLFEQPQCSGPLTPVFFCEGNVVILPYRVAKMTYKKVIETLINI